MEPRIFISYRREDAAGDAGRLADHLYRRFGADRVFLDIDAINPGIDFVDALHASLQQTAAILVVVGPRWTTLRDAQGTRRLDDDKDFVRLEVEAALGRRIPVVPVLVQGATMPRREELPPSLAAFATRQAAVIDHAEFHDDAERLCDRLAKMIGGAEAAPPAAMRRWWPAAALVAVLALGLAGYVVFGRGGSGDGTAGDGRGIGSGVSGQTGVTDGRTTDSSKPDAGRDGDGGAAAAPDPRVEALLVEASAQRRRSQLPEALETLARARALAPASQPVQRAQEDVAMEWIRNVRVESGKSSFTDAIKPALAIVDAALPSATGVRRADLLSHSGWATFLIYRDGNRQLEPAEWYREALAIDAANPYANAMLAHWTLFRDDDLTAAMKLFDTAVASGRALDAVRTLQWAGYANTDAEGVNAARVRLADSMRRGGEALNTRQAQALYNPYYFAMPAPRGRDRQELLAAIPPDDHLALLTWAFDDYLRGDDGRRRNIRYYEALLHERAGRAPRAIQELRALNKELTASPGSLRDAVQAALKEFTAGGRRGRQGG
jgi:hypothetical protein